MLRVINPTDESGKTFTKPADIALENQDATIFLAGPCPRDNYDDDWRKEAIEYLKEADFNGVVFNPTNPNYDTEDVNYLAKQTKWEVTAMENADVVVFWIARNKDHPAFTTNIELGYFLHKELISNVEIGMPDWAEKNNYIKERLKLLNKNYYSDLKELMQAVANRTSDYKLMVNIQEIN